MSEISFIKMKTGVYRCKDDIKNFKLSVKLKKLNATIPNIQGDDDNTSEKEEKIFSWQQKVLSKAEFTLFAKSRNCLTNVEKRYHKIIKKSRKEPSRIFSYVHTSNFCEEHQSITTELRPRLSKLYQEMINLTLLEGSKDTCKTITIPTSNSAVLENVEYEVEKSLKNSISNPFSGNSVEFMMIMADLGRRDSESQLWHNREHLLCFIIYDKSRKWLSIFPDFSKKPEKPYIIETDLDEKEFYEFTLENVSNLAKSKPKAKDTAFLEKIMDQTIQVHSELLGPTFVNPPRNVNRIFLFFEILTAKNFENDSIYVQYNIDLPENWSSSIPAHLYGTTQTCQTKHPDNIANFSYYFDVSLDYLIPGNQNEGLPTVPTIYLQVVSRDIWSRYRVEGLVYKCVPVFNPGTHVFELQCLRILPKSPFGDLRRYFVGDYCNINDISWISIPNDYKEENVLNKYGVPTVGTGTVTLRVNIVNQSKAFQPEFKVNSGGIEDGGVVEHMRDMSLSKTVAEVIDAYKRAKDLMIETRTKIAMDE